MRRCRVVLPLLTLLAIGGCVTAQPRVARDAPLDPAFAYVGAISDRDTAFRFGFQIFDHEGHDHVLAVGDDLALIQLPPGKYAVFGWMAYAMTGEKLAWQPVLKGHPLHRVLELGGGQVTVLGRWTADRAAGPGSDKFTLSLVPMTADAAAAAVREAYPGLAGAPVVCPTCAP